MGTNPGRSEAPRWFPPAETATRVLLLRHGSTRHSGEGRFSGRNELPLDDHGMKEAEALADHVAANFAIRHVVSSPLRRARETAAAVSRRTGAPVEVHADLVETDFGAWEGLTMEQAHACSPDLLATWLASATTAPPQGESFLEVEARVEPAIRDLVTRYPRECIAVVSHVTPIKTILRLALSAPPETMFRFHLDTASLSVIDYYEDGTVSVRQLNSFRPG